MYDLIQKILRRKLTEGRLSTHTPSNPSGGKITAKSSDAVITKAKERIFNAMKLVASNPNYGDLYHGDGLYQIDLYPNGNFMGKMTSILDKREAGTYNDSGYGQKRTFFVKSCTNIQHPDQPEKTCKPVGKSPMEDAVIKVLAFFGNDILEFLSNNIEGEDVYTTDSKEIQQKDYLLARKKERKDSELAKMNDAKKNRLTLSPMEEKLALRDYALKHGVSVLDILNDLNLRRTILQQYQESKK
jgi:hypothetical protein